MTKESDKQRGTNRDLYKYSGVRAHNENFPATERNNQAKDRSIQQNTNLISETNRKNVISDKAHKGASNMNINSGNAKNASRRINADRETGMSMNMIDITDKAQEGASERNIDDDNVKDANRRSNDTENDRSRNIKTTEVQHEANKKIGADSINKVHQNLTCRGTSTDKAHQYGADDNLKAEAHQSARTIKVMPTT